MLYNSQTMLDREILHKKQSSFYISLESQPQEYLQNYPSSVSDAMTTLQQEVCEARGNNWYRRVVMRVKRNVRCSNSNYTSAGRRALGQLYRRST
jgi:hypothetical protein